MRPASLAAPGPGRATSRDTTRRGRYGAAAIVRESEPVRASQPGGRNRTLNRAAFCLGQLVAGGAIERQTVEMTLLGAARLRPRAQRGGGDDPERDRGWARAAEGRSLGANPVRGSTPWLGTRLHSLLDARTRPFRASVIVSTRAPQVVREFGRGGTTEHLNDRERPASPIADLSMRPDE